MLRPYTEADLDAIKAKHGVSSLVEGEIITGAGTITLPLLPFTVGGFDIFTDEHLRNGLESAEEALMVRSIRHYTASEIKAIRRACVSLPGQVFRILAMDAGWADDTNPPSRYQVDPFNEATPPLVLEQAGLEEAAAEKIRGELHGTPASIVAVINQDGETVFGGVLAAPGEGEQHILAKARADKKGLGPAARSAVAGCLRWHSAGPEIWQRYPAIPVMHLVETVDALGGGAAIRRFRRR